MRGDSMFWLQEIFPLVLLQMLSHLLNPLFWLVVVLIGYQYRRLAKSNQGLLTLGQQGKWWRDTLQAAGFGLIGGMFGSFLMVFVGLTLSGSGLMYIWPVAILLLLINPRFICFAYAGGILAFSSLVFGWPQISVPQVLALVAILHLVESGLIYFSGHLGAVPVYIKADGRLVGGYLLQRFWPIPAVALLVMGQDVPITSTVGMPDWWPLIKPALDLPPENLIYTLIPVVAGLGYGDVVAARTPKQKASISAVNLSIYSIILLMLAVLADDYYAIAIMGAVFSPLGHELLVHLGQRIELTNEPVYVPVAHGVKLLDVIAGTPAWQAGLRSGDIITEVNNLPVRDKATLGSLLHPSDQRLVITYISQQTQQAGLGQTIIKPGERFGIIVVPEANEKPHLELNSQGALKQWLQKLKSQ